jgi:hypothetical protein
MNLTFSEAEAKAIWDDKAFLSCIQGCTEVITKIITEPISSTFKYLLVRPIKITFSKRTMRLGYARSNALASYVGLHIQPVIR